MKPQLYESGQLKSEWKAQSTQDSYQVSICTSEGGGPFLSVTELVLAGGRLPINPPGEESIEPCHQLLRMYAGLTEAGVDKVREIYHKSWDYIQRGSIPVETLLKFFDNRLVEQDNLGNGIELVLVEDRKFVYGQGYRRKQE